MLRILEQANRDQETNLIDDMPKAVKRSKASNNGTPNIHDGLIVDYSKFT